MSSSALGLQTKSTTAATTTSPKVQKPTKLKVGGDVCYGDFRYPSGCSDCDYKLSWNYMDDTDEIEFSLETKLQTNSWTGLGLSKDGSMVGYLMFAKTCAQANADLMVIKSVDGNLSLHDMYSDGPGALKKDAQQNLFTPNVIGTHANGVLRAQFIRKRNTGDKNDKSFGNECWKMMFPVSGGELDQAENIMPQVSSLLVSENEVCIKSCREEKKEAGDTVCENSYRHPPNCVGEDCEDGQMTNSDIYTGWVYEGKAFVTDRFAYGRQLPAIDPADRQDIYDIGGKIEDEVQTLWFRRAVHSKDRLTDYPLDQCYYFLFPIGGGRVLARKSSDFTNPRTPIGYHDLYQPRVSSSRICICDASGKPISEARTRRRRQAQPTPSQGKPNAMECTDMVVGSVIDGRGRVQDMYSPSKAPPRPDSIFGGSDSLTGAAAFSEDGLTTVVFRKKLHADDKYDHSIRGPMTVIWAKGADPNNYQHTTGGAPIQADPNFFTSNSFKYHGRNHRGVLTIDFFEESRKEKLYHGLHVDTSTCSGVYSFPANCELYTDSKSGGRPQCKYLITWISDGEVARFTVQALVKKAEWTALGFSLDGAMVGSDVVVIGLQSNEQITVTDQFMPVYGRPVVDEQQDIFDVETSYKDGVITANFSRELFSEDERDINLQKCVYLLFTPAAGKIEPNGELRKHGETPIASRTKICLNTCSEMPTKVATKVPGGERKSSKETSKEAEAKTRKTTVTPKKTTDLRMPPVIKQPPPFVVFEPTEPVKSRYGLRVRILNKNYVPELGDPQSEYYQSFTKSVTAAINDLLAKRWKGMQVSKIVGYSKGSVIAEFEVVSVTDVPRPIEVKSLLEETAIRGNIGELSIEPSTIKTNAIEDEPTEEIVFGKAFVRNIIIIAAAAVLLVIAVVCTCCLLCRVRKNSRYVSKIVGYSKGSVIAEFEVVSVGDVPRPIEVKSLLEETAIRGNIGELSIEPSTIKTNAIEDEPTEEIVFGKAFVRNIIIIAAAAVLLVIAVVCTCCLLCRVRKNSRYDSYPVPQPAPYLYGNGIAKTPAGFDNAAFLTHQRHYSQATTASTKPGGNSPQSAESRDETPGGIGETTYHEWSARNQPLSITKKPWQCLDLRQRLLTCLTQMTPPGTIP
ncbi:DOMON domain protein [Oesophagostomum dentatum]|uniref:DOMON domain protein n=1 Tax=Oesophagostomum dentatum TaxID=61180 RepID=A0A0B1T1E7_OESDE|nr:DOMON domain protein [Oesophagostomum dentatum]